MQEEDEKDHDRGSGDLHRSDRDAARLDGAPPPPPPSPAHTAPSPAASSPSSACDDDDVVSIDARSDDDAFESDPTSP